MNKKIYQNNKIINFIPNSKKYKCIVTIDAEDWDKINKYKWYVLPRRDKTKKLYIYTPIWINKKRKTLYLHRYIMNAISKKEIDHIDHNTLNNCKNNLRYATRQEQGRNQIINRKNNTTGYKGVSKQGNKYIACIWVNNTQRYLGMFNNKIDAAKTYNEAASKYFNEFACLNKI